MHPVQRLLREPVQADRCRVLLLLQRHLRERAYLHRSPAAEVRQLLPLADPAAGKP